MERLVRTGLASMVKGPSSIGPAKLTVSEIGSPMFEYRDAEQAEKDILKSATLADAFQASAAVRKAITPSRRHKAA